MLNNILHVPKATKNLLFVHHLASNKEIIELFRISPDHFLIKDQVTKKVLLEGSCYKGLYPLPSTSTTKQAFGTAKPSLERGVIVV